MPMYMFEVTGAYADLFVVVFCICVHSMHGHDQGCHDACEKAHYLPNVFSLCELLISTHLRMEGELRELVHVVAHS